MLNRRQLLSLTGGALASPFVLRRAWAQEHTLSLHLSGHTPAQAQMAEAWADAVEAQSDGRIAIRVETPAPTEGAADLLTQVRDGTVDIAWSPNHFAAGRFPRTEVFELPGVFTGDPVARNLAMRELFNVHLAADYQGLHVILIHADAGLGLQMVDAPVRAPSDLAGKLLRVATRIGVWTAEALGTTPVVTALAKLRRSLSEGLVEGCLLPWGIIPPFDLQELTQYQIEGPDGERFGTGTYQISMNRSAWNALPLDLKQIIRRSAGDAFVREVAAAWREAEDAGIEMAEDAGNELITLTEDEMQAFRDAIAPVTQRWIDDVSAMGIDGQALYDLAKATIAKHSSDS